MGAFPLLTSLTLLPPAVPAGVLTLPLLASLALLAPAPTEAQSASVLVSRSTTANPSGSNLFRAFSFRTGGNLLGYDLSEMRISFRDTPDNEGKQTSIKIRNNGSGQPGSTVVATLTRSGAGVLRGEQTFTAPSGTRLTANTIYWVSIGEGIASSSNRAFVAATSVPAGTVGGLPGWSLVSTLFRTSEPGSWNTSSFLPLFSLRGFPRTLAPRLTGATPGNGQVTLTWNKVTGAAGYQYLVLNADKTRIVSTDWFSGSYGDQTSGVVTGLTNGRQYHFQVRAMKRGPATRYIQWIRGPWSTPPFPATPEGPPPPVENIRVTPNGTSLTVTWDASAGATGYDVTYTDNSSGRTARAAWDHAGTSVTITCDSRYPGQNRDCVRSGATYSVGVRAKNDRGASGWRNSGRPPTEPQPQPPAGDACQTQLTGDGSVAGFWNERCDSAARRGRYAHYYSFTLAAQSTLTISLESRIDTYLLLRRGGQDGPVLHRNDDWGGSYNSRISETLAAGTYTIEATTYHRWESGNFTLGVSGLGSTAPPQGTNPPVDESTAPDPVTNIRVRHNGTSLSVEWDASARATGYDVTYYDTGSRRNWRAAWNRAGTRLRITCDVRPEHSDEGCINSHTYTVGIRARNAAGTSAWTNSGRASEGGSSGSAAPAPALSVADATAAESSGAITFAVTLSPAAARWVYVDYSTHDGTASAGLDYTAGSGTLTFRPGETRKTVTLALLDDAYDEGSETLELMLSNAQGALLEDGLATGTITNDDPVPQAWISRFGRTVAHQVLDAVEGRMQTPSTPGREVVIAGAHFHGLAKEVTGLEVATLRDRNLLTSSSFALTSEAAAGELRWSLWGRGALTSFDGRQDALTLDGNVTSALLGADWTWDYATTPEAGTSDGEAWGDGRWRAGLLLSHSRGDGSYSAADHAGEGDSPPGMAGKVKAHLTGLFPWARRTLSRQLAAWGVAGYGQGELTVTAKGADSQADGAALRADLNLWLAAVGLRGTLINGGTDGLTITGTTDAMVVGTSSGSVTGADGTLAAAQATVTRLRLGLTAQRPFPLGNREASNGATLTPSLEMGLRHDGGDAETGFGLDLGGGIALSAPEQGLAAELRGRALLSHAAEGFRDQGFSGSLSWHQEPASDRGAVLSLTHTLGGASSGGAEALLSRVNLEGLAANNDDLDRLKNQRLELKLAYGLPAFGDRLTLTPELGLGLYGSGRDYRIGWNLTQPDAGESFLFSFDATRREDKNGTAPEHGIELRLDTRF